MREAGFEGQGHFVRGDFIFRPAHYAHADLAGREGAVYVRFKPSAASVRRWVARNGWHSARGHVCPDRVLCSDDLLEAASRPAYQSKTPSTVAENAALLLSSDAALRVREVANMLCLAPYELTRRFTAEFGMTPTAYRRQARVQRAIKMLCEGASNLAQVAQAAGYHDQSHLTIDLRRETGMTPGAMRVLFG